MENVYHYKSITLLPVKAVLTTATTFTKTLIQAFENFAIC